MARPLLRGSLTALVVALAAIARPAAAQSPVFDAHVHLWRGETSLRAYEQQLEEGRLEVAGIGAMWFGGPNQVLAGQPKQVRAGNDGIIALTAKHPKVVPVATVHPYDGAAAEAELERVVAAGVKVIKLHPTTRTSCPAIARSCSTLRCKLRGRGSSSRISEP
jgi:hypothetical protein